jgi:hypothetical protein
VLSVLPPLVRRRRTKKEFHPQPTSLQTDMIRNYLTVAWRTLVRHKAYSFINVFGLAVGMAAALLIGLWVRQELSYDKFHKNHDRVAMIWKHTFTMTKKVRTPACPSPSTRR